MSWIAAAAVVVGAGVSAGAASKANSAMSAAYKAELIRQGKYQGQALTSFDQWAPTLGVEQARTELGNGEEQRKGAYESLYNVGLQQGQKGTARDKAYFDMTGANRAKLGAWGDWDTERNLASMKHAQELGKITNFAAGDASVFPYRMYKAQHSADDMAFWGNLISSLGSMYSGGGGGGVKAPNFGRVSQQGFDSGNGANFDNIV